MTTERTVQELADRVAIQDVIARVAIALDRRDPEMLGSCFTRDAVFEYVGVSKSTGAENIKWAAKRMERYSSSQHTLTTQRIQMRGDEADAETYAVNYFFAKQDGEEREVMVNGGRYSDLLVRSGGRWQIQRRTLTLMWQRGKSLQYDAKPTIG